MPNELRPIVQVIDDWNTNRRLGLVWECRVGRGKLLVCSADLNKELEKRPAARQLRESLVSYTAGKRFNPKVEVSKAELARLFEPTQPSNLVKLGARVIEADSEDSAMAMSRRTRLTATLTRSGTRAGNRALTPCLTISLWTWAHGNTQGHYLSAASGHG